MAKKVCPMCKGKKELSITFLDKKGNEQTVSNTCNFCEGTGRVKKNNKSIPDNIETEFKEVKKVLKDLGLW